MPEEMEFQSVVEMALVDPSAWMPSETFLDHDAVTAWPLVCPPYHANYGSLGLLSSRPENTSTPGLTDSAPEVEEVTPGSRITGLSPTIVNEIDAPPASPLLLKVPISRCMIPQLKYALTKGKRSFRQLQAVTFSVGGVPGFNMQCALKRTFKGLDGRDDSVLEKANGPVSCRLLFPGYPMNDKSGQIAAKNWKKNPAPITKSKLAHEVAKRVNRYLQKLAAIPIDPATGLQWMAGQGCMKLEKMYLTKVSWVSQGSVQPEIWVDTDDS